MGSLNTPRAAHAPAPAVEPLGATEIAGHSTSSQHVARSASSEQVLQAHSTTAALSLASVPRGHCRVLHFALPWQLEQIQGTSELHCTARVVSVFNRLYLACSIQGRGRDQVGSGNAQGPVELLGVASRAYH